MKLQGVIIPAAVPTTRAGEPDTAGYRRLLQFLMSAGADGIFANGSMGGFATWTDSWQRKLIDIAVSCVNGRLPLLAGVSDTGVERVLERIRSLADYPVDAFVVTPPYFYLAEQAELLRFYTLLADASPKPLVLYDNPRLCKNGLAPATILKLAAHPNITGIKASSADAAQWQAILQGGIDRERFSLISGAGRLTSLALRLGFDGITEGLHNIVPHLAVALYAAARSGDFAAADALQAKINRCFRVFEIAGGWRGLGVALRYLGIADHGAAPPYDLPLSEEQETGILEVLESEAVLQACGPFVV